MGLTMPMTGGIFSSGLAWVGGIFASLMLADSGSASSGDMPVVQYGALGLAAILVAGLLRMLDRQTKSAEAAHRQAMSIAVDAMRVIDSHTDALKTRPCLMGDRIFKAKTELGNRDEEREG